MCHWRKFSENPVYIWLVYLTPLFCHVPNSDRISFRHWTWIGVLSSVMENFLVAAFSSSFRLFRRTVLALYSLGKITLIMRGYLPFGLFTRKSVSGLVFSATAFRMSLIIVLSDYFLRFASEVSDSNVSAFLFYLFNKARNVGFYPFCPNLYMDRNVCIYCTLRL